MLTEAISLFTTALSAAVQWLSMCFNQDGLFGFYLSVFFILLCYRFLLSPILGSAGSDKVKKEKDK